MIKLALLGHPVKHSFSPLIHSAAFKASGIQGSYEIIDVMPENIEDKIKELINNGYRGFNVTIPHKVAVNDLLSERNEIADKAGCVNTVIINSDGTLSGYNTDVYGISSSLSDNYSNPLITGAGGAARAAVAALADKNIKNINFLVRNPDKCSNMLRKIQKFYPDVKFSVKDKLISLESFDLLINATPLGMTGSFVDLCPVERELFETANKNMTVFDLIYTPDKTNLLKVAEEYGLKTINGLNMLIRQAQKAFEIWTGILPDYDILLNSLKTKL